MSVPYHQPKTRSVAAMRTSTATETSSSATNIAAVLGSRSGGIAHPCDLPLFNPALERPEHLEHGDAELHRQLLFGDRPFALAPLVHHQDGVAAAQQLLVALEPDAVLALAVEEPGVAVRAEGDGAHLPDAQRGLLRRAHVAEHEPRGGG